MAAHLPRRMGMETRMERILQRAREKSEIQRMVIQGGSFKGKGGDLKPKEVVSLLLDDDEIEKRCKLKVEEEERREEEKKREDKKRGGGKNKVHGGKKQKLEEGVVAEEDEGEEVLEEMNKTGESVITVVSSDIA